MEEHVEGVEETQTADENLSVLPPLSPAKDGREPIDLDPSTPPAVDSPSERPTKVVANGLGPAPTVLREAEEAMDGDEPLGDDRAAVSSSRAPGSAAPDSQIQDQSQDQSLDQAEDQTEKSIGGEGVRPVSSSGANEDGEESALVDPREGMKEIRDLLGEIGYGEKRAVIEFLADPTVRPVDPKLPPLSPQQEERLLSFNRSVREWDDDLILVLTDFLEAARQQFGPLQAAGAEGGATRDSYQRAVPNEQWPNVRDVIPFMRRRVEPPNGRPHDSNPRTPSRGLSGSAFEAFTGNNTAAGGERGAPRRFGARAGYDADELVLKRQRLDEDGKGALVTRRPGSDSTLPPPESPATPRNASNASARKSPPLTPAAGSLGPVPRHLAGAEGLGGGTPRDRRRMSSGSVLRYRSRDFTPGRRSRPSMLVDQGHGAGTLGQWLGADEAAVDAGGGGVGGGARDNDVGQELGRGREDARRGGEGQMVAPAVGAKGREDEATARRSGSNNKRASSPTGLDGVDPKRHESGVLMQEKAKEVASRVSAESKATAEVGNILMSVLAQEGDAFGGKERGVREHGGGLTLDKQNNGGWGKGRGVDKVSGRCIKLILSCV